MDNMDGTLWTPRGNVNLAEKQVAKAVKEYDQDLILGQRADGEWVVFLQPEGEQNPFPVLGLGFELPNADQVKEKLYKRDTRRNGRKIYQQMLRRMDASKKAGDDRADDQIGVAAEAMESAYRRLGGHSASGRIFVPGRD